MIPITKILFDKKEENAVIKVMRSGQLAQGQEVERFENEFAKFIGTKFAAATSNGTTALHLSLLALGIKKGDEVITTPFSFIASTNTILYVGAKPVFVDIKDDFNIDVSKIEEKITSKTKAILPVHLFGDPCDMDKIMELARKYNLKVIEDACQAHGAEYQNKKVGSFGDVGCFSFYATKNMTAGEGGMITTNDKKVYEKLKMLRSHGSKMRYYHDFLGYNFRMTEIQAAIGLEQLKKLEEFNSRRINNAKYLSSLLKDIKGIIFPRINRDKKHVFHQYTVTLNNKFPVTRKELVEILTKKGIEYGIFYPLPIHKQKEILDLGICYNLPKAEALSENVLSLPIHPKIAKKDLDFIAQILKKI